jgi:hypothetical protein
MTAIDGTGLHALEELADRLHADVGEENICASIEAALARAEILHTAGPASSVAFSLENQ